MSGTPTRIRRGQIWTVVLPSFPKPRPALVVSIDPINDLCPDVLMVPITTKPGPLRIALGGVAEETGLRRPTASTSSSTSPTGCRARTSREAWLDLESQWDAEFRRQLGEVPVAGQ